MYNGETGFKRQTQTHKSKKKYDRKKGKALEIYNRYQGYWQVFTYDGELPPLHVQRIKDIPKDHPVFGWLEVIMQGDNSPMWEPKWFRVTLMEDL
jgi:hypothetical protein